MNSIYNPPVFPLTPSVPPQQTVTGYMDEFGLPNSPNKTALPGQPPMQAFWNARNEYIGSFNVTNQQPIGTQLASIDILRACGDYNDIDQNLSVARSNLSVPTRIIWPRSLLINSAQFFSGKVTYTFWAIKPQPTAGRIRFVYIPDKDIDSTYITPATQATYDGANVPINFDSRLRNYIWEWDLEEKPTYTLDFVGNNPLQRLPTCLPTQPYYIFSGASIPVVEADETEPFFNTTYGSLHIFIQNPYAPGSIYPTNFNIHIFKSLPDAQYTIQTGHRSGASTRVK